MIKVTLEVDGVKAIIKHKDGCNLSEVLEAVHDAIRGCGFFPRGVLDYVEEE